MQKCLECRGISGGGKRSVGNGARGAALPHHGCTARKLTSLNCSFAGFEWVDTTPRDSSLFISFSWFSFVFLRRGLCIALWCCLLGVVGEPECLCRTIDDDHLKSFHNKGPNNSDFRVLQKIYIFYYSIIFCYQTIFFFKAIPNLSLMRICSCIFLYSWSNRKIYNLFYLNFLTIWLKNMKIFKLLLFS